MFDKQYIGAWDLADGQGRPRDVTVEIEKVVAGELVSEGNKKTRKPILHLVGKEKRFAANVTNSRVIAGMYGNDTRQWVGKLITLYPTTTKFGRDTVDCIRVRGAIPKGKTADKSPMPAVDTRPEQAREHEDREREPGADEEIDHA